MQVEILGPDGRVHYRREHDDPDMMEALNACEYSVFVPRGGWKLLSDFVFHQNSGWYECWMDSQGMRVFSSNRDPSFTPVERAAE